MSNEEGWGKGGDGKGRGRGKEGEREGRGSGEEGRRGRACNEPPSFPLPTFKTKKGFEFNFKEKQHEAI